MWEVFALLLEQHILNAFLVGVQTVCRLVKPVLADSPDVRYAGQLLQGA
jgi:hypothetical protein